MENFEFDLRDEIHDLVVLFETNAKEKGLEIITHIDAKVPKTLKGDSFKLRQILVNLVGNAVKFTKQGMITIRVMLESSAERESKLRFMVQDTGIGIPKEKIGLLFERFSQIDNTYQKEYSGTGLGLAISKKLVEFMNGEIWVESEIGVGSKFTFTARFENVGNTLMTNRESISVIEENPIISEIVPTILVVEDDKTSMALLTTFLKKKGINIETSTNGKEALWVLEKRKVDLILMDVQMPEMDGFTAVDIIRRNENNTGMHTPIIAMTAYALKDDLQKCLQAGMDDYIAKPLDLELLVQLIIKWLDKDLP